MSGANLQQALFCQPIVTSILPSDLTGLIGWWDASISGSLSLTGSDLNSIADQSGGGNTMSWGGFGKPTYGATLFNGAKPGISIDTAVGSDLAKTSFPMGTGNTLTIFVVCQNAQASSNSDGRYLGYSAPGHNDWQNVDSWSLSENSTNTTKIAFSRNASVVSPTVVTISAGYHVLAATVDSSGVVTTYVDGVATGGATVSGNWATNGTLRLGMGDNNFITAKFGEWGVATGFHSSAAMAALCSGLKTKWGF